MSANTVVRSWRGAWDSYWFTEAAPELYAMLRIALGLVGMMGLVGLTPPSMYWLPDSLAPTSGGGIGLRSLVIANEASAIVGYGFYAALWIAFACMVAGIRSSVAVAMCFVGSALQGFWNPLPLSSAHKALVAFLFCLMWADTGRALSVDAWWHRPHDSESFTTRAIWPLRLMRVQVAAIYLSSGLFKLFGNAWRDGSAVHYALQMNAFHRFAVAVPPQLDWVLAVLTYVTLFWELSFVVLLLHRRTRMLALGAGVLIHLGMTAALEVGTFGPVMLAGYLAFMKPGRFAAQARPKPAAAM